MNLRSSENRTSQSTTYTMACSVSESKSSLSPSEEKAIALLQKILTSESISLARRFRALFSLKHLASQDPPSAQSLAAIQSIAAAFSSPSALLKHELAYCLGQTKNLDAVPILRKVLEDKCEDPMCRHEAAEAIGALGDVESLELLRRTRDDPSEARVVRETCEIAVDKIEWERSEKKKQENLQQRYSMSSVDGRTSSDPVASDFASIDPAPPLPQMSEHIAIPELQGNFLDTRLPLFQRYRAMFALRNLASPPDRPTAVAAIHALASGFGDPSALFRHEIAFVFGQLSHPASIPSLVVALSNTEEESMVRHEAAEALGSLGEVDGVEDTLRQFQDDPEQVVRDSVIVALDMAESEKTGELEYAIVPSSTQEFSPLASARA